MSGKAMGELGLVLHALVEQQGTQTALAQAIGCGIESLGRWIRGDAKPSPKYSEQICALYPDMRQMLEAHGCFTNPAQRPRSFNRPLSSAPRALRRRGEWTEGRKQAAARAKKARRLDMIKRRHAVLLRKAQIEPQGKQKRLRSAEPARRNRVSHSGDFIERMDELTAADARFVPTYEMEGL